MSHRNTIPQVSHNDWSGSWSAERQQLRALVGELRREIADLQAKLNVERAKVRHLETAVKKRWWKR